MNILFICNKSPYPPKEGGSIAMYNLIVGLLKQNYNVMVLSISTPKLLIRIDEIPDEFVKQTTFESGFIDTTPRLTGAFKNIFTNKSYHISRFENPSFAEKIKNVLKQNKFDIIQLESLFVAPYLKLIRHYSDARIVLRSHNIEHQIWERIAVSEKNLLKRIYLKIQAKRLKRYELTVLNSFDGIASITRTDGEYFRKNGCITPVKTIPFGIDKTAQDFSSVVREFPSLFFLGTLNWIPNTSGLRWFIDEVWNAISEVYPDLHFYIAGRHAPPWLRKLNKKGIFVLGEVEDALSFMSSKSVMVVPLFSGSGMRVKIIEGMYASDVIISTTLGAEGIDYTHEQNILIADTAYEFIKAIQHCIEDQNYCEKLGREARKLIDEKYLNDKIISKLIEFYKEISLKKVCQ